VEFHDFESSEVNIHVGPYGRRSLRIYGGWIDGEVSLAILRGVQMNASILYTQRATKGFLGPEHPKVGYLIRSNPPLSLLYLPTVGPMDDSLEGYLKKNFEVRCVAGWTEQPAQDRLSCRT
jgi:hypothetical protein